MRSCGLRTTRGRKRASRDRAPRPAPRPPPTFPSQGRLQLAPSSPRFFSRFHALISLPPASLSSLPPSSAPARTCAATDLRGGREKARTCTATADSSAVATDSTLPPRPPYPHYAPYTPLHTSQHGPEPAKPSTGLSLSPPSRRRPAAQTLARQRTMQPHTTRTHAHALALAHAHHSNARTHTHTHCTHTHAHALHVYTRKRTARIHTHARTHARKHTPARARGRRGGGGGASPLPLAEALRRPQPGRVHRPAAPPAGSGLVAGAAGGGRAGEGQEGRDIAQEEDV